MSHIIKKFSRPKVKKIITLVTIIVILASGTIVYAMNTSRTENKILAELGEDEKSLSADMDTNADIIKEKEEVDENLVNKDEQIEKNDNQQSQVAKSPITYKSENLGVAFDIPASGENSYLIKEVGTEIAVIMKSNYNSDDRGTLLFIIDGDINSYNYGDHLDSIDGIEKRIKINGKEYLVGGPTDYRDELKGQSKILYDTMLKERSNVIKTLRGI